MNCALLCFLLTCSLVFWFLWCGRSSALAEMIASQTAVEVKDQLLLFDGKRLDALDAEPHLLTTTPLRPVFLFTRIRCDKPSDVSIGVRKSCFLKLTSLKLLVLFIKLYDFCDWFSKISFQVSTSMFIVLRVSVSSVIMLLWSKLNEFSDKQPYLTMLHKYVCYNHVCLQRGSCTCCRGSFIKDVDKNILSPSHCGSPHLALDTGTLLI